MKGLELAECFYSRCRPMLMQNLPHVMQHAAAGLVGEGSECLGLDDEISQDHDFGAAFCLWIPGEILEAHRDTIEHFFAALPDSCEGYASRFGDSAAAQRVGPLCREDFITNFLGTDHAPASWQEWMRIPEHRLACFSGGKVFEDADGGFSAVRDAVQRHYPTDVFLKKLAARTMQTAQAGQYNLPRSLARGDSIAAMLAAARFAESAMGLVYLLNRRYMPFYKHAGKMLAGLPILGKELHGLLCSLAEQPLRGKEDMEAARMTDDFCGLAARRLVEEGFSDVRRTWLWLHGPRIAMNIQEKELRTADLLCDSI